MTVINRALWTLQLPGVLFVVLGSTPNYTSTCNKEKSKLACNDGERIVIRSVEYGARKTYARPCQYQEGDCRYPMETEINGFNTLCSGHRDCTLETRVTEHPKCEDYLTVYKTVHYECILESQIVDMCSSAIKSGTELFLANQEYPDLIKGGHSECVCVVQTAVSSNITVEALDVRLAGPSGQTKCQQEITVSDLTYSRTFNCLDQHILNGYRQIYKADDTLHLDLKFLSVAKNTTGRYIVRVAGSHPVKVTCTSPGLSPKSVESSSVSSGFTDRPSAQDQPDGVLIGGVVAAALFFIAFIVAFVIMVIRHRKRRLERQSSQRAMDIKHGVIDPFILSSESGSEQLSQSTNTPTHARPELVYATPGYTQPYDGQSTSIQIPLSEDQPVSHYTYITPDIIDTTGFQQVGHKKPPVPVPRIPRVPPFEDKNGNMPYFVRNQPDVTERRISQRSSTSGNELSQNGNEVICLDNSLYESADLNVSFVSNAKP